MKLLLPVLSLLGIEAKATMQDWKQKAIVYGAMAGFLTLAGIFLLVAAFIALAGWIGPLWAALALAGLFLLIVASIYIGYTMSSRASAREEEVLRRSGEKRALLATTAVSALPVLIKSSLLRRFGLPLGAAVAVYYVLTRSGNGPNDEA